MRNPPNGDVEVGDVDLPVETAGDLVGAGYLEEQAEGLLKVSACLLDAVAPAGDVQLRAEGVEEMEASSAAADAVERAAGPPLRRSSSSPNATSTGASIFCARIDFTLPRAPPLGKLEGP